MLGGRLLQNCQNVSGFRVGLLGICLQELPLQASTTSKHDKEQRNGDRTMSNIIEQWIESRGNEALQKLLHDETLIFEDKIVLAMVANHEEVKPHLEEARKDFALVHKEMHKEFTSVREETRKKFVSVNARLDKVDAHFDKTDARIENLRTGFTTCKTHKMGSYGRFSAVRVQFLYSLKQSNTF
jgi:hypothetical protein